jgi:histidinol-phosphate aminotransferase
MVNEMNKKPDLNVPERIASLVPYPPGKPIEELERELGITGSIKLALEGIRGALNGINRYPDGSAYYLKEKLANKFGLPFESFFIGNGSNEVIELLVSTFASTGEVVYPDPSFAVYPIAIKAAGAIAVPVALRADLTIDLEAMIKMVTSETRLVFIANPNNPTGTMVSAKEFDAFMERVPPSAIVCMDEAYAEYVTSDEYPDTLKYVKQGRAVIGLRTFSKIFGLAGLRVGYGFAPPEIIGYLERVRQPFNVNSLALAAALPALDDTEHVARSREVNADGLKYLYAELDKLGIEYVSTEANFFLIKVGDGKGIYDALLKTGVIVRPMAGYGLGEYIRVTVGLSEENERFIKALADVVAQGV